MNTITRSVTFLVSGLLASPAIAHHSYAMFDGGKRLSVQGTVAKLEWQNPHVLLWVYVREPATDGYTLYAFESDSANALIRHGWTKDSLQTGEKVTVEFFGLRDGRSGGHFIEAKKEDGSVLKGEPGPINGLASAAPGASR